MPFTAPPNVSVSRLRSGEMSNENKKSDYSHFFAIAGGAAFGYWLSNSHAESAKRSRAEIDDPEMTEEACE